jgi:hypothetical protein
VRRCYKCKSTDHLIAECPLASDDEDNNKKSKKDKKDKKMSFSKKKKGGSYVVTWDSDASSDDDDNSNDDDKKTSKKKALASIAINNKPSLFDSSSCFMAKATKVKVNFSNDDDTIDNNNSDSSDDDGDEPSVEQLMDMLEQAKYLISSKSKKCKDLSKKLKTLEQSFDKLNATHERLEDAHEKLGKAHTKLEEAHSLLLEQSKKEDVVVACDVGVTCEIINESFYQPIVITPTNTTTSSSSSSSSTSTCTLTTSDDFTCDASLMVENETLKKEVDKLILSLGNAYGEDARLLKCLGSQRFSHSKEGLGYTPKKGKMAFVTPKHSFVRSNGRFCNRCKQVGHIEKYCITNKNKEIKFGSTKSIRLDSCYMLTKGETGVKAKYIGTLSGSPKKKAIWVPKSLVTNLQGPKQAWVPKKY